MGHADFNSPMTKLFAGLLGRTCLVYVAERGSYMLQILAPLLGRLWLDRTYWCVYVSREENPCLYIFDCTVPLCEFKISLRHRRAPQPGITLILLFFRYFLCSWF